MNIGETKEFGTLRIHLYRSSIKLWDLVNAGKRGKKVRVACVCSKPQLPFEHKARFLSALCEMLAGASSYDQSMDIAVEYMREYPGDITVEESEERGVDVAPAGF